MNPEDVLTQLKLEGVAEEGCNNYYGSTEMSCTLLNKCKDCENGEDINKPSVCSPKRFYRYRLKEYGKIRGLVEIINSGKGLQDYFNYFKDTQQGMICPLNHSEEIFNF